MRKWFELLESYFAVSLSLTIGCYNKRSDENKIIYRRVFLHRKPYCILCVPEDFPFRRLTHTFSLGKYMKVFPLKKSFAKFILPQISNGTFL